MEPTSTPAPDDRALLGRARSGDRTAFSELYDRHVRAVYWQAFGVVRDDDLAEDVTQEVFITAWRKLHGIDVVDESLLPWLLVTARYTALNARRGRLRQEARQTDLTDDAPAPGSVEADVVAAQVRDEIARAVARLSETDRRIYDLCVDGNHSYEQAAGDLGLSHAAVRNRLSRLRSRLRADLHAIREPA